MSRCDFHKIFPKKRPNFRPLKNLFYHSFFFQKFHSCFFRSFSLYIYLVIHIHHLFCGDGSFHHIHNFLKLRIFFQGFIPGNGHSLIRREKRDIIFQFHKIHLFQYGIGLKSIGHIHFSGCECLITDISFQTVHFFKGYLKFFF